MTDPTTGPSDDVLDTVLRGMVRPAVDPARREMHIATALDALGEAPNNVVSLVSRRGRVITLSAVAAVGLFLVGLGIGRVSAPRDETPSPVKNAALGTAPTGAETAAVEGCADLTLAAPREVVTTFGDYAIYRIGTDDTASLVVVDTTACTIVARVAFPAFDGG